MAQSPLSQKNLPLCPFIAILPIWVIAEHSLISLHLHCVSENYVTLFIFEFESNNRIGHVYLLKPHPH